MLILIPYVYGFHWRRQCIYLSSKFKTVNKGSYTWVVEEENSHGTIKASLYHVFTFHICNDLLERPKSDRTVFYSICIWFALVKKMPKVYRSSKNIKCIQLSLNEKMERLRIKDFCHFVLMSYGNDVNAAIFDYLPLYAKFLQIYIQISLYHVLNCLLLNFMQKIVWLAINFDKQLINIFEKKFSWLVTEKSPIM